MDSQALRARVQAASLRTARLEGQLEADTQRRGKLANDVAMAKGRESLAAEISTVLDSLQNKAHERSVGSLENLLSKILTDVMPEAGKVRLIPQYKGNATHLDIDLDKDGNLEDALEGNGGAVVNVLSTGLRYASLVRTKNRRLMVLDEPDCWMHDDRMDIFARTIAEASVKTGTQTIFITHKDHAAFEGVFNMVKFVADEAGEAACQPGPMQVSDWVNDEQVGIRSIELFNFRRHRYLKVPCFPGATAYSGGHNLGKSTALMASFRAVAYGDSSDKVIRHGCDEATVVFHIEDGQRIEWSRSKKRSPTVLFRHFRGDELVSEGPSGRGEVPSFVMDVLKIARVDDLDIQVGNQKKPVFLLNETAPKRAQILSVGKESSHLRGFMKMYQAEKAEDRSIVQRGELEIAQLQHRLVRLASVPEVATSLRALKATSDALVSTLEQQERLGALLARIESTSKLIEKTESQVFILQMLPDEAPLLPQTDSLQKQITRLVSLEPFKAPRVLPRLPEPSKLTDVTQIQGNIGRLEKLQRFKTPVLLPKLPELPVVADVTKLLATGITLGRLKTNVSSLGALQFLELPSAPALADAAPILAKAGQIGELQTSVAKFKAEQKTVQAEVLQIDDEILELKEGLGDECPLCGHSLVPHAHTAATTGAQHVH
jgi:flagellin-like hook-associated protein FlgL